jgi:RNA polymerase sigma factor (sigma-70 family)
MDSRGPIEWADIDEKTQEQVTRGLMRVGRVSREAAQEAFHSAAIRLITQQTVPTRSVTALLVATGHNIIRDQRRTAARDRTYIKAQADVVTQESTGLDAQAAAAEYEPEIGAIKNEEQDLDEARVRLGLQRLTEKDRLVLTAYHVDGLSAAKIDRSAGLGPGTTKQRLLKARERFRAALSSGKPRTR